MTWDAVALRHLTDKASCDHGYMDLYEARLARRNVSRLLEVGVAGGASVRMWAELFPDAQIIGVDIHPDCRVHAGSRITIVEADATRRDPMLALGRLCGPFDVVVDDGSHDVRDVMATLDLLWPFVSPGGVYAIEDITADGTTQYEADLAAWGRNVGAAVYVEFDHRAREARVGPSLVFIEKGGS